MTRNSDITIEVDMDAKCSRCHKVGALPNGLCMSCITKRLIRGDYDYLIKEKRSREEEP